MHRAVRLVLAFLLVAAIPLQGLAAATMTLCASGHASSLGNPTAAAHDAMSGHHRADHHMHHRESAASAEGDRSVDRTSHASLDKQSKPKCSVCASCCSAAAMPSPAIVFAAVVPTAFFAPTVSIGPPAFLTAGLERPPRAFLA
jgi:hypothetical protein